MTKRKQRALELIAEFKNGYAVGWHFAVGECFKDQLDIKQTERMETLIGKDGKPKQDKNGKPKMKEHKVSKLVWTQGNQFTFSQGDIFYDTPKAYELKWGDALKVIGKCCRVIEATPDTAIDKELEDVSPGTVTFTVTVPKKDGSGLEEEGERFELSQGDFVEFLKTGKIRLEG